MIANHCLSIMSQFILMNCVRLEQLEQVRAVDSSKVIGVEELAVRASRKYNSVPKVSVMVCSRNKF